MFSRFLDWGNLGVADGMIAVGLLMLALGFYLARENNDG